MCGIVGIVDLHGRDSVNPAWARAMTSRLVHRGPDGEGYLNAQGIALGMRRLSIIDLSGGDQPIYNEDRSLAVVCNGEIYNYVELREELSAQGHTFSTRTDVEVIPHLYEQYGLGLFAHLRGMYAFALWDAARRRLLLAVDHIGIKPLYLYQRNGRLFFASEIKALAAVPDVHLSLDVSALDTFLSFGYMLGQETLFADVRRLSPGHYVQIDTRRGTVEQKQFWRWGEAASDPQAPTVRPQNAEEAIRQARALLRDAVRLHLRSDVPLGLFLSGGVDSATVLALMSEFEPGSVRTYTVGYDVPTRDNEQAQAARIAAHFGAQHHEHTITAEDWWEHLVSAVYHADEPIEDPAFISLKALAEVTARDVKVVLGGIGGDELFGGYPAHRAWPRVLRWNARLRRLGPLSWAGERLLRALERGAPTFKRWPILGALPYYVPRWHALFLPPEEGLRRMASFEGYVFSDKLRRALYTSETWDAWQNSQHKERAFAALLNAALADDPEPINVAQAVVAQTWLPAEGLLLSDKITMAHSLELRVPFFDRPLLDFAITLPPALKVGGNKWLLREAMRPYLPSWALQRPKKYFGSPVLQWLDGPLRPRAQEILLDPQTLERGYFRPQALGRLLARHFSRREEHVQLVSRLLLLELWQRAFFGGER